jgi:hypothetical protein
MHLMFGKEMAVWSDCGWHFANMKAYNSENSFTSWPQVPRLTRRGFTLLLILKPSGIKQAHNSAGLAAALRLWSTLDWRFIPGWALLIVAVPTIACTAAPPSPNHRTIPVKDPRIK